MLESPIVFEVISIIPRGRDLSKKIALEGEFNRYLTSCIPKRYPQ